MRSFISVPEAITLKELNFEGALTHDLQQPGTRVTDLESLAQVHELLTVQAARLVHGYGSDSPQTTHSKTFVSLNNTHRDESRVFDTPTEYEARTTFLQTLIPYTPPISDFGSGRRPGLVAGISFGLARFLYQKDVGELAAINWAKITVWLSGKYALDRVLVTAHKTVFGFEELFTNDELERRLTARKRAVIIPAPVIEPIRPLGS